MRTLAYLASAALMAAAALPAAAGDFDGSKLLICAPVEAMDCSPGSGCEKSTPDEIGAPAFMRIDVGNKVVRGPKRAAPIELLEKTDEQLVLQGTELGFAWTLVIDQETGKMSATLVNREGAFVLFGPCTNP